MKTSSRTYKKLLAQEAAIWSKSSLELVKSYGGVPEWSGLRNLLYNQIYRGDYFNKELTYIKPNMNVLELGCSTGWFTFEAWRIGANIDAVDIAQEALSLARDHYQVLQTSEKKKNTIQFIHHDLSQLDSLKLDKKYDVVVIKSVLHHLVDFEVTLKTVSKLMHAESILIVEDSNTTYTFQEPINASFHIFLNEIVPNLSKLLKACFRLPWALINWNFARSVVHAHDLSPFEGVSSGKEIKQSLVKHFTQTEYQEYAAYIGNITHPISRYPQKIQQTLKPWLHKLNTIDQWLIKRRLSRGTNFFAIYKKK